MFGSASQGPDLPKPRWLYWRFLLGAGALSVAGYTHAQSVTVLDLTEPESVLDRGFTRVAGLRVLSNGALIIVDSHDRSIVRVNTDWSVVIEVGRQGRGPGEYLFPTQIFTLSGDSTGVFDPANDRILVLDEGVVPAGFLATRASDSCGAPGTPSPPVQATDGRARFYTEAPRMTVSARGTLVSSDSAAIDRWDPTRCERVTVANVSRPEAAGTIVVGTAVIGGSPPLPFAAGVDWAVGSDGSVAIVHPDPFHVVIIDAGGQRHVGNSIPHEPLRLEDGHKEEWRSAARRPQLVSTRARGQNQPNWEYRRAMVPEPSTWPRNLPPFLRGATRFAPDGMVWVQRTMRPGQGPSFDLIDETGTVVRRISLPAGRRLVGLGRVWIYAVRTDDSDVEHLERYRAPQR